ncbi:protease HtpX [Buchnera aphidicola]|uniref:protease HtpX n=1 Tax=Buchnera aphidicola TaxID=9 RepID=UPI0031B73DA0
MLRIFLFIVINFFINITLSIILHSIGVHHNNILNILLISGILGCLGSIISLLLSKWIALKTVNGYILKNSYNSKNNWILKYVYQKSLLMKIKTPDIAIYNSLDLNAFATGFSKNNSLIALSTGLLNSMSKKNIKAVLAHELCHIENGDMLTMTLIQSILNTFIIFFSHFFAKIFEKILFKNKKSEKNKFLFFSNSIFYFFISLILEFTFGILANIIIMWFSRKREFYADAGAANIVGKKNMISALLSLKKSVEPNIISNLKPFYIHGNTKKFLNLFLSHPTIDDRILALKNNIFYKKSII